MLSELFTNHESVRNLMLQPHGRRMICGIVALAADKEAPRTFFEAMAGLHHAEQAEIRSFLNGRRWPRTNTGAAIRCGLIETVTIDSPAFESFIDLADENNSPPIDGLFPRDLASPIISTDAWERLWKVPRKNPLKALLLNPNANTAYRAGIPESSFSKPIRAAAAYGDLRDRFIVNLIEKLVFESTTEDAQTNCCTILCRRKDLPDDMIVKLDKLTDGAAFWDLSNNPRHASLCQSEQKAGLSDTQPSKKSYFGKKAIRLYPGMDIAALRDLLKEVTSVNGKRRLQVWQHDAARIAAHPNSDDALVDSVLQLAEVNARLTTTFATKFIGTRYEEKVLRATLEKSDKPVHLLGGVRNCSASSLLWAFNAPDDQAKKEVLLTHPNFPWSCHSGESELTKAALAAKFLSGAVTSAEAQCRIQDGHLLEALFDPTLSTVRLNRIIKASPELAPLVAVHPNSEVLSSEHPACLKSIMNNHTPAPLCGRTEYSHKQPPGLLCID